MGDVQGPQAGAVWKDWWEIAGAVRYCFCKLNAVFYLSYFTNSLTLDFGFDIIYLTRVEKADCPLNQDGYTIYLKK